MNAAHNILVKLVIVKCPPEKTRNNAKEEYF